MTAFRPQLSSVQLSMLTAAYLLLGTNATFWTKGAAYFEGHPTALLGLGIGLWLIMTSALIMVSMKYVIKPMLMAFVMIAAVASYYVDILGIVIDRDMIQNMVETTPAEAGHLVTMSLVLHVILFGVVPSALIAWTQVTHRTVLKKAVWNTAFILPALLITSTLVFFNYSAFASTFREHRDLMASLNPAASVVSAGTYVQREYLASDIVLHPFAQDAGRIAERPEKPKLFVLVVGETARAQNFSLLGYERQTNPELEQRDVLAFGDVSSCGTATAVSVPCMFSVYPRIDYSEYKALSTENLLDILKRADVDVSWLDNNTGSKKVAQRVREIDLPNENDPRFCSGGECRDDILVDRLKSEIANVEKDTVIVLHQIGSHGPAYYGRYPEAMRRFTPDCRTSEFADCTSQEIVNAYDNTILETDHNLAEIIDLLKTKSDDLATAMLYVSDHGESLGENGIYLHAAPYFMAPSTQTHVPMIAWFSQTYRDDERLDLTCMAGEQDKPLSHDNLFHTVLGIMDIQTREYQPALDFLDPCREQISVDLGPVR